MHKIMSLTDQTPEYEDPYVLLYDFVFRWGNPIYIYQGGTDDNFCIVSTKPLPESERKMMFDIADAKAHQ